MPRLRFSVVSTILAFGLLVLLAGQPAAAAQNCDPAQPAARPMLAADDLLGARADEDLGMPQFQAGQMPSSGSEAPALLPDEDSTCDQESQQVELGDGDCFITNCSASEACYFQFCENGVNGECDQTSCTHGKCIECYDYCESMCGP
jgi:hypothetical protein